MRRRALLSGAASGAALVMVAGCVEQDPTRESVYRDPAAPFGAVLRFDPARFAGAWDVVGAIGLAPGGQQVWTAHPGQLQLVQAGGGPVPGAYATDKPGRLRPQKGEVIWVLWVDDGHRTAVLSVPSGRWALILNRGARIPADRRRAALDILDWSGFDLTSLREG